MAQGTRARTPYRGSGGRLSRVLVALAVGWLLLMLVFAAGLIGNGAAEVQARALATSSTPTAIASATATKTAATPTASATTTPATPVPVASATVTVSATQTVVAATATATPASSSSSSSSGGGYGSSNANVNSAPTGPQPTKVVFAEPTFAASNDQSGGLTDVVTGTNSLLLATTLGCATGVLGLVIAAISLTVLLRGGYGPFLRQLVRGKRARKQDKRKKGKRRAGGGRGHGTSGDKGRVRDDENLAALADDRWAGYQQSPRANGAAGRYVGDEADPWAGAVWGNEEWDDVPATPHRRAPSADEW